MNNKLIFAAIAVTLSLALVAIAQEQTALAKRYGETSARVQGTTGQLVTTSIQPKDADSLQIVVTASGGNFNNTNLVISGGLTSNASQNVVLDTIPLGTKTILGVYYDDANLANDTKVNPATLPYIKIATSAGVGSVKEVINYQSLRNQ